MADPKLPTPDEVVDQTKEEKKPKQEANDGKKYDGGEIPKQ